MDPLKFKLVTIEESRRFMIDCFKACNVPESYAEQMADLLVNADYRKHFTHGIDNLELYISDLQNDNVNGEAVPTIITNTPIIACVDGKNGLGAVVGNFCMDLAIKKAKEYGIGWVSAKHSNEYGMSSWYTMKAMKEGLIGLAMSSATPVMVPTGSKESVLGENPISLAVPAQNDKFILDMTTTVVSKNRIAYNEKVSEKIPIDWALDNDGKNTTDPNRALQALCLLPLGGYDETSGSKGFGLAVAIDILCGVLNGTSYLRNKKKWLIDEMGEADLGHVFIAINPKYFSNNFEYDMAHFNRCLRCAQPIDSTKLVLVPGDKEEMSMRETDSTGGIKYSLDQIKICKKLAKKLRINPLKFKDDNNNIQIEISK